jgi:hypothetical protein
MPEVTPPEPIIMAKRMMEKMLKDSSDARKESLKLKQHKVSRDLVNQLSACALKLEEYFAELQTLPGCC